MSVVARAADEFSCGDIVNRAIRQHQRWSLMPFGATVGSVLPAFYMRGFRETFFPGEMNFPRCTPMSPFSISSQESSTRAQTLNASIVRIRELQSQDSLQH